MAIANGAEHPIRSIQKVSRGQGMAMGNKRAPLAGDEADRSGQQAYVRRCK